MKRCCTVMLLLLSLIPCQKLKAQDPIALIIKEGIEKVIRAVDLKIQRLQNETIWLQNAQKVVENTLSKLRLDEITDWVERQRMLYRDYFEELQKVKTVIVYYHRVREITDLEAALVTHYKKAYAAVQKDGHFSAEEIKYMGEVYSGIVEKSIENLDALLLVIHAFTTQMTDAKRMEIIDGVAIALRENYDDLKRFTNGNRQLSLARAKEAEEIQKVKTLYGF